MTMHWVFSCVQCCLESLGQHCPRFLQLLVQCSPKINKATLNRIFSCAMLSGVSRTILHRVLICATLSQEYQDNIELDFFLCIVAWNLLDNISQGFDLCNIVPRVFQTGPGFCSYKNFPVQEIAMVILMALVASWQAQNL